MNKNSIAYCGLICSFCCSDGKCNCKSDNNCGKKYLQKGVINIIAAHQKFIRYLEQNEKDGIVYHRSGVIGDYDLSDENEVLHLLRRTK